MKVDESSNSGYFFINNLFVCVFKLEIDVKILL